MHRIKKYLFTMYKIYQISKEAFKKCSIKVINYTDYKQF